MSVLGVSPYVYYIVEIPPHKVNITHFLWKQTGTQRVLSDSLKVLKSSKFLMSKVDGNCNLI